MRLLVQTWVVSRLALAGLPQRKWSSLVLAGSVACVVGVLLSMLSVTAGLLHAYRSSGDTRDAIVLSADSNLEFGNGIPANTVGTILDAPGIAAGPDGHPLGDAEFVLSIPPLDAYVMGAPELRGIGAEGFALRPDLRMLSGRRFQPGRQEVIVGVSAARAYHLRVGDRISLPDGAWPIVGSFSDNGSILESQLLGDADTVLAAGRMSGFSSVRVRLEKPEVFAGFSLWLANNPALKVSAEQQSDYALRTVNRSAAFFTGLTYLVGAIMALGALFGIVKLMYAAVNARTREIATLRTIGYQPLPLAISVLLEATVLSVAGALLGAGAAWLLFDGRHVLQMRTAFDLSVSPHLFSLGVTWALVLALLGGLPPALRAARLPVADALRVV